MINNYEDPLPKYVGSVIIFAASVILSLALFGWLAIYMMDNSVEECPHTNTYMKRGECREVAA